MTTLQMMTFNVIHRWNAAAASPVAVGGYGDRVGSVAWKDSTAAAAATVAALQSRRWIRHELPFTAATCNVNDCCCWRWCYWWWWWSPVAAVDAFLLWRWRAKWLLQLAHHVSGTLGCISRALSFFSIFERRRRTSNALCRCDLSENIFGTNAL